LKKQLLPRMISQEIAQVCVWANGNRINVSDVATSHWLHKAEQMPKTRRQ